MCFRYFSCHCDQTLDKKQLTGEEVLFWLMVGWDVIPRGQEGSSMMLEARTCGLSCRTSEQQGMSSGFLLSACVSSEASAGGMVLPTSRSSSSFALWKHSQTCPECVSSGVLGPVDTEDQLPLCILQLRSGQTKCILVQWNVTWQQYPRESENIRRKRNLLPGTTNCSVPFPEMSGRLKSTGKELRTRQE